MWKLECVLICLRVSRSFRRPTDSLNQVLGTGCIAWPRGLSNWNERHALSLETIVKKHFLHSSQHPNDANKTRTGQPEERERGGLE